MCRERESAFPLVSVLQAFASCYLTFDKALLIVLTVVATLAVRFEAAPLQCLASSTRFKHCCRKYLEKLKNGVFPSPVPAYSILRAPVVPRGLLVRRQSSQERLESGLKVLSLSSPGDAAVPSTEEREETGKEVPLDSLLASAADVGGLSKSSAHQVCVVLLFRAVGLGDLFLEQHRRLQGWGCACGHDSSLLLQRADALKGRHAHGIWHVALPFHLADGRDRIQTLLYSIFASGCALNFVFLISNPHAPVP